MEDKYAGQGGKYLLDAKTGKRKLISRTQPVQPTESLPTEDTSDAKED